MTHKELIAKARNKMHEYFEAKRDRAWAKKCREEYDSLMEQEYAICGVFDAIELLLE